MAKNQVLGVILAGGKGRRMGLDKAQLCLGGQRMLDRACARLAPQVAQLAISVASASPSDPDQVPVRLADPVEDGGPLAGILAGLQHAQAHGFTQIVSAAVDTPFFPQDLVARLLQARQGGNVALPSSLDRAHPTFALWPVSALESVRAAVERGQGALIRCIEAQGSTPVRFDAVPVDPFFNVNTPADMDAARALLEAHPELT
ncbi:MAG: molybdenum cofactor guanylyltransferase [Neomegalonema sp.]|nr:molybdenum cofactor guanylyltransferase [Neomegalonema sp.]